MSHTFDRFWSTSHVGFDVLAFPVLTADGRKSSLRVILLFSILLCSNVVVTVRHLIFTFKVDFRLWIFADDHLIVIRSIRLLLLLDGGFRRVALHRHLGDPMRDMY